DDFSEPSNEASRFLHRSWLGFAGHPCERQSVITVWQTRRAISGASFGCPLARAFTVLTSTHTADRNPSLDEVASVEVAGEPAAPTTSTDDRCAMRLAHASSLVKCFSIDSSQNVVSAAWPRSMLLNAA